jgi:hypothetical protein
VRNLLHHPFEMFRYAYATQSYTLLSIYRYRNQLSNDNVLCYRIEPQFTWCSTMKNRHKPVLQVSEQKVPREICARKRDEKRMIINIGSKSLKGLLLVKELARLYSLCSQVKVVTVFYA